MEFVAVEAVALGEEQRLGEREPSVASEEVSVDVDRLL